MLRWCKDNQLSQLSHAFSFVLLLPHFLLSFSITFRSFTSNLFFFFGFFSAPSFNITCLYWNAGRNISASLHASFLFLLSLFLSSGLSPCCLQLTIILMRTGCLTPWKMHEDPSVQKIFKKHFNESVAITH